MEEIEDLSVYYLDQNPNKLVTVTFIQGNEAELEFPELPLLQSVKEYAKKQFQNNEYENEQTGWSIKVHKNSYRHEARQRTKSATFLAYQAIPALIKNGILLKDEPNKSRKPFVVRHYTFLAPLMIDREIFRVRFTVQRTTKGMFYYSTNSTKMAGLSRSTTREAKASAGSATDRNPAYITLSELLNGVNEKDWFICFKESN